MSDALEYLVKARPETITSYLKFLKESGKHLDTRSRDLISVITKVAVQTENGFRQYLSRALRNGATPNEILDALLMVFPVLGLAKIVWAFDIATGECVEKGNRPLYRSGHKVENGRLLAYWQGAGR
jgi:alkylhydroperoxidase/carboxymuconolactone decarboxylase family protein YurZ